MKMQWRMFNWLMAMGTLYSAAGLAAFVLNSLGRTKIQASVVIALLTLPVAKNAMLLIIARHLYPAPRHSEPARGK